MGWLGNLRRKLRRWRNPDLIDLSGDRELEWGFVAGHIPDKGVEALDFGCGNAPLALVAALKGYQVLAMDLGPVQWTSASPNVTYTQADVNTFDFGDRQFDVILNCSTVEHVGLAGRYGSTEDADGDLQAMARLREVLKPSGQMVMTIPVGQDLVCRPLHRIYGKERLPRLTQGYAITSASYWLKRPGRNMWTEAEADEALALKGGPGFYALGLFVLRRSDSTR